MASFAGISFYETSQDGYPSWSKAMILAIKPIPNETPVIQEIGLDVQRAAIAITCTAAQLTSLYDQVLEEGVLIMDWETVDAFLESISPPQQIGVGEDLFTTTLNLIKTGTASTPSEARVTESGDVRVTETGDTRITE